VAQRRALNLLLLILFSLNVGGATALPFSADPPSSPVAEKTFTLDNGLRVFLLERHSVALVNIVAGVNAGSRDETDETSGLAHALEHCLLFRGNDLRSGSEVARRIRDHGAVFNARTGQDETLFEITLPAEHFVFGLENQKELLFRLKIEETELEAEKEVIREEIRQIEDDPFRLGRALASQLLFSGHPYGRPVYGTPDAIRRLTVRDIEDFYRRLFVPNNAVLAVVGDLPIAEMEARVREVFADIPRGPDPPLPLPRPRPLPKTVEIERTMDVDEAYLFIASAGPDYGDEGQYAADILAEILGQGIRPMLAAALQEGRRVLANSARMEYVALKRAGAFVALITLEPKNLSAAKREAIAFLRRVRTENFQPDDVLGDERYFTFDYLEAAKNNVRFLVQRAWESGLGLAASVARHMLLSTGGSDIVYLDRIAALTSNDLRDAADAAFTKDAYAVIAIRPQKK